MSINKLTDPAFLHDPAPMLHKMRAEGPLVQLKVPLIGTCWATTQDAAAREVLKDDTHFARNPANAGGRDISHYYWFLPPFMRPVTRSILGLDNAEHARIRSAVDAGFSRMSVDDLRPEIRQIADNLLDQFEGKRRVDISHAYARQLPLQAICVLLGIEPELRGKLARAIAPISNGTSVFTLLRAIPGLHKSLKLLRTEIATIKATPRAGLLSTLIHDKENDLSDDELLSLAFILFIAGHETTLHLISDAILSLCDMPEYRSIFIHGTAQDTARAVEEFLRFYSPVMMTKPLFVRKDFDFHGQRLKQGDKMLALLIAANHDPKRFENGQDLRLDRKRNAHLAFGFGPHVCLGMQLARAEAQIALERLFQRYPNLQRDAPNERPTYAKRYGMRGLKKLVIRLNPGP